LFIVLALVTLISLLLRYLTFSYRIEGHELITREGIIERQERHIPLEKVQEIRIEQNLLHRAFDVVEAVVETAGAEGAEAKLSVLSRADAERLREAVAAQTASKKTTTDEATATSTTTEREIIRKLNIGELALHGLTSNHLLSALAIIGALWAFADDILPDSIYERLGNVLKNTAGQMYRQGWRAALMVIMGGLVIVLLIGLIVSVVGSIVKFFNFTLARQGDNLYRNYGLLTRRASSLPRRRIQVLKIEQGMIRRWFDLATLRADISGSKKEDEDDNAGRDVLMPIVKKAELEELLSVFFPTLSSEPTTWKQVSRLAIRRGTTVGTVILLLIAVVLCANLRSFAGLWLMLLTPLLYWINVKSYRNFGYVLGARFFRTRSGWLGRETHIVPIEKSQVIVVRQSPFDRRLNLATLRIDTAGQAYTGGSPSISNLPVDEALAVARTLAQEASKAGAKF
jgi:putative membrane protein